MATFNVPMLGTEIKPVPQTSLGDMLGIARGAQAYQQAQQINPLELQAKQQATRTGEIQLSVAEQADKERSNMQTFFADPNNFQTNGRIDIDKINKVVPTIAPLTGTEYINKYTTLGNAQTNAIDAKQKLTQEQRSMVAQRFSILGRLGVKDKNAYIAEMDLLKKENPDNPDLSRLIDSYKTIWENTMQSGDDLPGKAIAGAQTLMTPAQQQALAPSISTTAEGKTVTTQPSVGAAPPIATMGMAGGLQANVPTGGPSAGGLPTAGTQIAPGMSLPYPVRRAEQPYIKEPSEEKDQASGALYRDNLVTGQTSMAQSRRNVLEVMQQANLLKNDLTAIEKGGGFAAKVGQKIRMFANSAEYDMLAKDLANMAITNSKTMGSVGGTVAGLDMAAVANGTIKVPPEVLVKIANRVEADLTNIDLQASGAQQFSQKFGDNNMKAYQQAWNANARDTRIFEAMNLLEKETDPNKLQEEFKKLFPSEKKRKTILKQYKNLKSLAATGVQAEPLTPEDF
jgi:hypothetical protein